MSNNYEINDIAYIGHGSLVGYLLDMDDNPIGNGINMGSMTAADVNFEITSQEVRETQSGTSGITHNIATSKTGTVNLTAISFDPETVKHSLYGNIIKTAAKTGETKTATVSPGDIVIVDGIIDTVTDVSDDSANMYVEGENYAVSNGGIQILSADKQANATTPLTADTEITITYSTKAIKSVEGMVKNSVNMMLVFDGINIARENDPLKVTMYKVSLSPTSQRALISTEQNAEMQITGTLLMSKRVTGDGLSRMYKEESVDHDAV